ncbi:MAG: protein-disulfide reductase DsbD domain-containing protein, partial [Acidobacteriota bacterium]
LDVEHPDPDADHARDPDAGLGVLMQAAEDVVRVRGEMMDEASPDGWHAFRLELEIEPGWHVQANPASEEYLVATELTAEGGAEVRELRYPQGSTLAPGFAAGHELSVFADHVVITGEVRGNGRLVLRFQPCDDLRCLPPVTHEVAVRQDGRHGGQQGDREG